MSRSFMDPTPKHEYHDNDGNENEIAEVEPGPVRKGLRLSLCEPPGACLEVGVDEVGRGSLAGPVVAGAVIWNPMGTPRSTGDSSGELWREIRDSKKLSPSKRSLLSQYIREEAIDWALGEASAEEIDRLNILRATHLAMHRALDALRVRFDSILVDGDRFKPYMDVPNAETGGYVPHDCIIEGDSKYVSVAAASIIAKVHRDAIMHGLSTRADCSAYGFDRNVGYGTALHVAALRDVGASREHRLTFVRKFTQGY